MLQISSRYVHVHGRHTHTHVYMYAHGRQCFMSPWRRCRPQRAKRGPWVKERVNACRVRESMSAAMSASTGARAGVQDTVSPSLTRARIRPRFARLCPRGQA